MNYAPMQLRHRSFSSVASVFLVFGMLALILKYKRQLWFTAGLHLRGPINHRPRPLPAPQTSVPENVRDESCEMLKEKLGRRRVEMNCR